MYKILIIITSVLVLLCVGIYFFFFYPKSSWNIQYEVTPTLGTTTEYDKQKAKIKEENQKNIELYNTAIRDQDATLCNGIKNTDKKNECHDMIMAATAKKTGNIETCDTLSNSGNILFCQNIIRTDKAISSHNKILCMDISDKNKRSYCEDQIDEIILGENIKNNTITKSICDGLGIKYQQSCLSEIHELDESSFYTEAINKNDLALCKKITNIDLKTTCSDTINLKTAIANQNNILCDDLINTDKKIYCQTQISKTNDITLYKSAQVNSNLEDCTQIVNENLKNKCHDAIIITSVKTQKDTTLCNTLTSTGMIESCKQIGQ